MHVYAPLYVADRMLREQLSVHVNLHLAMRMRGNEIKFFISVNIVRQILVSYILRRLSINIMHRPVFVQSHETSVLLEDEGLNFVSQNSVNNVLQQYTCLLYKQTDWVLSRLSA